MTLGRTRNSSKRDFAPLKVAKTLGVALCCALVLETTCAYQVFAQAVMPESAPGTLLLPLTPKMDEASESAAPHPPANPPFPAFDTSPAEKTTGAQKGGASAISDTLGQNAQTAKAAEEAPELLPTPDKITPEDGKIGTGKAAIDPMADGPLLKGTVQIVADDTEFDEGNNTFLGTGNAVAIIGGEDSKLEADSILYNQNNQIMDCRGNVRIYRNSQLTTGSAFKFQITKDEYLITNPDTEINGAQIVARKGYGARGGIHFKNGTVQLPKPFSMMQNQFNGPLSYRDTVQERQQHPDAFVPPKQDWSFSCDKLVYERYLDQNNLTVFGGKLEVGSFAIPIPKFTTTMGAAQNKVTFPVGVAIGNNLLSGGTNIGPTFSTAMGKTGILTWSPMVQLGGKIGTSTTSNTLNGTTLGSIGLAGNVTYADSRLVSHLAYGSVSNLLVADFKERIRKGLRVQTGINRYLDDGMYGPRRARLDAEIVDMHGITNIPFIQNLNFRSSAGWAQDNPALLNQSSNYRALFGNVNTNSTKMPSAYTVQEQITVNTHPIFSVGDSTYGLKGYIYGGAAGRAYSTGDANSLIQAGPVLDAYLGRLRLQTGYTQSKIQGTDPFVYDKFIQGQHSVTAAGDVKVTRFLSVGASLGYNMDQKQYYGKMLTAAVGPQDCKLLLSEDMVRGNYQVGFDILYGQKIKFHDMTIKEKADNGELGGL
ncbi:MAG TPA: hypothetical protein V6C81_23565 [Planktothrix sp.]|jgi:hypothetical protein